MVFRYHDHQTIIENRFSEVTFNIPDISITHVSEVHQCQLIFPKNMEKDERDKITALSPELIEYIDCNVHLISYLRATKTIGLADEHHLIALANKLEKSNALLNILCTRVNGYTRLVEGLRKTSQTGALAILNESIDLESTQHETFGFQLNRFAQMQITAGNLNDSEICTFKKIAGQSKEALERFTGRKGELVVLMESLLPDGGTASISGIEGIGKTQLAKMFLHKLDKEANTVFKQIVWINCESSFTATTDFTTIARDYLKVPILASTSQHRDISSILDDVYEKLQKSKSLIVLDNVETKEILDMYVPKITKSSKLSVLVTSRSLKIGTHIPLGSLTLKEAAEFVKKGLNIPGVLSQEFESGILELVVWLQMLPLAISQAIGYIREKRQIHSNYEPRDYLVDLERIPKRLFDRNSTSSRKTIYTTLSLTLLEIEASDFRLPASKILSNVAFMASDNVPATLFLEFAESDVDDVTGALGLLTRLSIIKCTPVDKYSTVYFSINRLVQDILRLRIAHKKETESTIQILLATLSENLDYNLISHALEAWKHATSSKFILNLFSSFPIRIICKMHDIGHITDAMNFAASSLIVLKRNLCINEHAKSIIWLDVYKSYVLGILGKCTESLGNLQATLVEAKKYLHQSHWIILKIRYYIALMYYECGNSDKTALICNELHKDYKLLKNPSLRLLFDIGRLQNVLRNFNHAHTNTIFILTNLHLVCKRKRNKLEVDAKCLLAHINGRTGNFDDCIHFYGEAIEIYSKNGIRELPNFKRWEILHNMGITQCFARRFVDAHDTYQRALNEMSGQTEEDCTWILLTKSNIKLLMLAPDKIYKELPLSARHYAQTKQIFGENSMYTLGALANIGVAYSKIGRHQDAIFLLTQLIKNQRYVLRSEDEARSIMYYLAQSLEHMGHFDQAIKIQKELRYKCLKNPYYKLCQLDQIESDLRRLKGKILRN